MKKLLPLFLLMLAGCNENSTNEATIVDSAAVVNTKQRLDSVSSNPENNRLGIIFNHSAPFEVVSFNRGTTLEYTGPDDTSDCKEWDIRKDDLSVIFKNSEPIDGTTWDLAFAFTTCVVEGQIKQKDELFDYSLNAGSWFRVTCRDTSLLFGDFNKRDRKYFLVSVNDQ